MGEASDCGLIDGLGSGSECLAISSMKHVDD